MNVSVSSPSSAATSGTALASDTSIATLIQQAGREEKLETKRVLFEHAYQILKQNPTSTGELFTLFHDYAKQTCYAQEENNDDEVGFRKAARLMELSFALQLTFLGLGSVEYKWQKEWQAQPSLDALVQSLEVQKDQQGKLFDYIVGLSLDPDVLLAHAQQKGIQETVAKTLTLLSYSHQNIENLDANKALHKKYNTLTEALITDKPALVDYMYNRCRFLAALDKSGDAIASYEPIKRKIAELWPQPVVKSESLRAQIENMQGILIAQKSLAESLADAEPYFKRAFNIRQPLLAQCETDQERFDQNFLLCNVRLALIKCAIKLHGQDLESVKGAYDHAQALRAFLDEAGRRGNQHCYLPDYKPLIVLAEAAYAQTVLTATPAKQ